MGAGTDWELSRAIRNPLSTTIEEDAMPTLLSYDDLPSLVDCNSPWPIEASDGSSGSLKLSQRYHSERTASDVLVTHFDVQLMWQGRSDVIETWVPSIGLARTCCVQSRLKQCN